MIRLEDVRVEVGEFALGPISLTVERGEHLVLLGPSGAGKTLLLEVIAGFASPDSGTVMLRGNDATAVPPELRRCAWMPQTQTLFPHLSVRRNIEFGLRCLGADEASRRTKVATIAARLGIDHLLDRAPPTLSGGEKQRVALARALVIDRDILLLDEPFSAVDPGRRQQLWALLAELHAELGLTIVHVTHDAEEALAVGRRGIAVVDGQAAQTASVSEILSKPASPKVAEALGMHNMLLGRMHEGALTWAEQKLPEALSGDCAEGPVWLSVAPQRLLLTLPEGPAPREDALHVAGKIHSSELIGEHLRLEVWTPTGQQITALVPAADSRSWAPGVEVRVAIPYDAVSVAAHE